MFGLGKALGDLEIQYTSAVWLLKHDYFTNKFGLLNMMDYEKYMHIIKKFSEITPLQRGRGPL